jgi:hypothetical protein
VDSSQVTYSRYAFVESGFNYPYPQTAGLDQSIYQQMFSKWGNCHYSGLISQVKSNNEDNLVWKDMNKNKDVIYQTKDMK